MNDYQDKLSWWTVRRPPLYGPVLVANLKNSFCGRQMVFLTRLPLFTPPGQAGWAVILTIFHPEKLYSLRSTSTSIDKAEKATESVREKNSSTTENRSYYTQYGRTQWKSLERMQLVRYQTHACVSSHEHHSSQCWYSRMPGLPSHTATLPDFEPGSPHITDSGT